MKPRGRALRILTVVTAVLMLAAVYMALIYAPTERTMGPLQRIFYFHLPTAIIAFVAFTVCAGSAIGYLVTGNRRWDIVSVSAAEIGEVFAGLVLLTGMLWARAAWNTWWTWDPRLTTTLVLWLIYAGYLILRNSIDEETRRARLSAVVGIIGFVDVPIVFMAIRWWRTIHPVIFESSGINLEGHMLAALVVSMAAFFSLFATLLLARAGLEALSDDAEYLRRRVL